MFRKLFDNIKQKFNIISKQPGTSLSENNVSYYICISHVYYIIAFLISILTVFFLLFSLIFNVNNITYDNFYYFIKDFDTILTSENYSSFSVDYNYEDQRSYIEYKGGFATIGQSSLTVYSATGRQTGKFYHNYSSPEIKGCSEYLMVYDQSGNDFAIYNSFARLYSETLPTSINLVEICDNGEFAIVTSTDKYRSVVYFYNSNFKRIGAYYYTEHITALSMSNDGKYMLVSLADMDKGALSSKILQYRTDNIRLYETGEKEAEIITSEDNTVIACGVNNSGDFFNKNKCYYLTSGNISMLTDNDIKHRYILGIALYSNYAIDDDGIAVSAELGNKYILYVESIEFGNFEFNLESKPIAIAKDGKHVFVLYDGYVIRYNIKNAIYQKMTCANGAEDIVVVADDSVIICYPSRALSLDFK